jgi:hypothetical protein
MCCSLISSLVNEAADMSMNRRRGFSISGREIDFEYEEGAVSVVGVEKCMTETSSSITGRFVTEEAMCRIWRELI